ncbi:MAG TPA: adenylate/guanylate cyclase domain-containing protein [Spirochaetia bacterium]|nr:adenylate/guanylate cyclase domain-containing protein [Spirochaetia bacterium]
MADDRADAGLNHPDIASEQPELRFRREIEEYYLPDQLINAILELGEIPRRSVVSLIGIGFLDIADYTFLSKFLSPNENQAVLDGLFTALHWVLKRHGGYLNKIEGDSMMFHYGGLTDPNIKRMSVEESRKYIAREIFYTCIEMQRVCALFNRANDSFLSEGADEETKQTLQQAFDIIGFLRTNIEMSDTLNALFQIRVRIGASIGEVTLGNIGPKGAKQWDVIGLPVITAKRMESTAPIGGLRISEDLYRILEETGIADAYYDRFKREAGALFSVFKDITKDELFKPGTVQLKDKKNVQFKAYSVQVSPGLPEALSQQVELLLEKGEQGADKIIEFLQYYRGNKFIIDSLEKLLLKKRVNLRKDDLLKIMSKKKYDAHMKTCGSDTKKTAVYISRSYSLYRLFELIGALQDSIKFNVPFETPLAEFPGYGQYLSQEKAIIERRYSLLDKSVRQNTYFYNVLFPLFFRSIKASILEYYSRKTKVAPELKKAV